MVQEHSDHSTFAHPFFTIALAFSLRYPNPWSPHVVTADTLSRSFDHATGRLRTTRLLLKRGALPRWAPRGIMERAESWVLEESEVDTVRGQVLVVQRNVDHVKVMEVVESTVLRRKRERSETDVWSKARVTSSWGFLLIRRRIERFGASRFARQISKSRQGVLAAAAMLQPNAEQREQLLDGKPVENYLGEKERLRELVQERLDMLRAKAKRRRKELGELLLSDSGRGASALARGQAGRAAGDIASMGLEEEEDAEDMTEEEENELADLERQHGASTPSTTSDPPTPPPVVGNRWFWWWRLPTLGVRHREKGPTDEDK